MRLRTLVVDDEPLARRRVLRLLAAEPTVQLVGECGDGREAVRAIRELRPDLVFLDVQMPEMDGFAVLRALEPGPLPMVVFVTAFDQYAIQAFEVHALDYLLKPFDPERLQAALRRAETRAHRAGRDHERRLVELLEHVAQGQQELGRRMAPPGAAAGRLLVKQGERMVLLKAEDVDWIESEGNYVGLHVGKQKYLVRGTMASMEEQLDPRRFLRIHRSTIVNLDRVKEVRPWFAGDCIVVLNDATELRLSRRYRDRLEGMVGGTAS
ncbi:MAG TPA: LytTR family DNA-binding domain-containing protein [Longimicrobium sp.]